MGSEERKMEDEENNKLKNARLERQTMKYKPVLDVQLFEQIAIDKEDAEKREIEEKQLEEDREGAALDAGEGPAENNALNLDGDNEEG